MQYPKLSGHLSTRRAVTKRATISLTEVTKFMSGGKRMVRGWASTVRPDRVGDVVEPKGGKWALPVPLLVQHNHNDPVGWIRSIELRNNGLWIEAEFAEGIESADRAWKLVEAELIDAFSIGFRATKQPEQLPGGGLRFTDWELLEISVVTVPANADARIDRGRPAPVKLVETIRTRDNRGAVKLVRTEAPRNGVPLIQPRDPNAGSVKLKIKGDGSIPLHGGRTP